jgi:ABC-type multidrug transport system ATPase subunit
VTPVPPNSEPDERTPVLPVPDTEPEREGSSPETGAPADRPDEPATPPAAAPTASAKPARKAPVKRAPRTSVPRVDDATTDGAADAADGGPGAGATAAKPARSTTRAPRTTAAPRSPGTRAPAAKKKPTVDAAAESGDNAGSGDGDSQRTEPATAAARVTVSRTPAARKTPAKPFSAKATRLPATTTPTADTAEAVEAATSSPATGSGDATGTASAAVDTSDETATTAPRPGSDAARQAAAKAASAKAAAAKTESAAKARAARAAATKAAAAKAAAARSAATAAARAATLAARATDSDVSAADAATATGHDSTAEAPAETAAAPAQPKPTEPSAAEDTTSADATAESRTDPDTTEQGESESSDDANAIEESTGERGATAPDSDADNEASADEAGPARAERRPFWRLGKPTPKQAPAVPAAPVPVSEPADAEPTAGSTPMATPVASVVRKPLPPRPTMSGTPSATPASSAPIEITVSGLNKRFGQNVAVADVNLEVRAGSFYGIVGPNGAGKTTTLSMITGLLRPDSGTINVHGIDVWADPVAAKRAIGVLPDRLRLFDRLTGAQLLYYSGVLRGLEAETVRARSADLAAAFGLESALNRLVADYSAGMTKKIALACAMIHSPRVLVLDEPFESVDPVSAVNVTEILQRYVASGGTVILSSHGMDLIQRVCDNVAIIVQGSVLASGTIDEVRGNASLEERFVELAGGRKVAEGLEWLHNFSD